MVRKTSESDIEKLKKVKPSLDEKTIFDRLQRQKGGEVVFLVLESDKGEVVSFVLLKWVGKDTHSDYPDMEDLYTKDDERGKGYGSMLVLECEKLAKEKGFKKIGLAVNPTLNVPAKRLYERLGYAHDNKSTYLDGVYDGTEDWVIDLEKRIN